jgi:DNA replication protein DnaC
MSVRTEESAEAVIEAACRELKLPTVRTEAGPRAESALRAKLTYRAYLADVLAAEVDDRTERRRLRRVADARFPRIKRLAEFNCGHSSVTAATVAALAAGAFIEHGDPIVLLGDSGTGKSHLLIGTGMAAAEAGHKVRYTTAAALVNELAEAADEKVLSRVIARYGRVDLLCIDLCRCRNYADTAWRVTRAA